MVKVTFDKVDVTATKYFKVGETLRALCIRYLQNILSKNNSIVIKDADLPEYISVSYDGGNHPEYASNVFSVVNRVYLESESIMLDTEDSTGYSIDNITTEDLYNLCNFIDTFDKELKIIY